METPKNRNWKVLKSEYLSSQPWFTVRREEVELPNGNRIPEYFIFEYPEWINVIAITKEQKFVFVSQYRHGLGITAYELCAGVCEKEDASPLVSAQRELLEETGYGNGNWSELMVIGVNPSTHTNLTYCYLATDVESVMAQHLEDTEDLSVHLLTLDEVKRIVAKRPDQTSAPCRPTLEIHGDESFDLRYFLNSGEQKQTNHKNKASCLCHNNSIGMARPFHQYGTTVSSAWHNRFIDMAQTLPAYDTTMTCCSA